MCSRKSKVYLALLVLVLVSMPVFAWSSKLVGPDSKSLEIHNQEVMIDKQILTIEELEVAIKLKDKKIEMLQSALDIALNDLSLQGSDSQAMLKLVDELKTNLKIAQSELAELKKSQSVSVIEVAEATGATEVAQVIVNSVTKEPELLGGIFGISGLYNLDGTMSVGIDGGVTYGMFGLTVGIQTDVGPITSMIDPTQFTFRAGLQLLF